MRVRVNNEDIEKMKKENPVMKADQIFQNNIKRIMHQGCWDKGPRPLWSDGEPATSLFITGVFESYDLQKGEFPLTTLRKIPVLSAIKEILWIYQDQSNDLKLLKEKYNIHWWDSWESKQYPGTIGHRYGYTIKKWNQIDKLLDGLKTNPYSRRHIMSLWDHEDFQSSDGLLPCAFQTLWSVRNDSLLDVTLVQRSSDYMTANHINKIQYVALQMMIAHHCGMKPGIFNHFVQNLHIYDRHIGAAEKMKNSKITGVQPEIHFNPANPDFFNYSINDFSIANYAPQELDIKLEIAI